jgi:hypothetical protein
MEALGSGIFQGQNENVNGFGRIMRSSSNSLSWYYQSLRFPEQENESLSLTPGIRKHQIFGYIRRGFGSLRNGDDLGYFLLLDQWLNFKLGKLPNCVHGYTTLKGQYLMLELDSLASKQKFARIIKKMLVSCLLGLANHPIDKFAQALIGGKNLSAENQSIFCQFEVDSRKLRTLLSTKFLSSNRNYSSFSTDQVTTCKCPC